MLGLTRRPSGARAGFPPRSFHGSHTFVPRVPLLRSPLFASTLAFALTLALPAKADLTSWLALGGGMALEHTNVTSTTNGAGAFGASLGVGTTPRAGIVVGGIFRTVVDFGLGTDISLAPRIATGGFARGDWGFAVDVGVAYRYWRDGHYGTFPLQGVFTLGAPWGLGLGLGVNAIDLSGSPGALGGFALLEIDLLRLTLMRQGSTDAIWKNPSPAGGRE